MNAAERAAAIAGEVHPIYRAEVAGVLWAILEAFGDPGTPASEAVAAVASALNLCEAAEGF